VLRLKQRNQQSLFYVGDKPNIKIIETPFCVADTAELRRQVSGAIGEEAVK